MKALIQILTFPFFTTLFFLDRVVLLFLWNDTGYKFNKWIYNDLRMVESIIRVFIFVTIVFFISVFLLGAE